ncbi:phenylalanine--tRNA ligase subunit beta ['Fragaria x ananassa' phyllody phytoplasma]|uniref:Phenylalanine--tRNA ligase beta subunit n=1 Tax='Fragaria x ananassa' phyllody phytoplasma TaxID=2358428 RepID=A0ABS5K3E5_9MOLU|nr:phenylalanine--tRNA ligase subunit beta ['Fragaria x ananassa' phyllody phytoplasma]MBS2126430.1 phenylalanine--tRNA ligase subunit beta ['Fragaria x ananassa' phyllody phytoplasma]
MKIIANILKQYLPKIPHHDQLFNLINNYICEVKSCTQLSKNTNLIVGKILNYKKIPNSKKLNLVTVDIGTKIVKIVCGAANLANNRKVIVASKGSFLEGVQKTIKNKSIYGVFSEGMICALDELGLDPKILTPEEQTGIYLFDDPNDKIILGQNALIPLGLAGLILELGITPNRADLLSYVGFVKDLEAVIKSHPSQEYQIKSNSRKILSLHQMFSKKLVPKSPLKITIESNACYEYNACILENISIKPSPLWLRNTLLKSGVNPINNVVDITNLILLEYGIPLHAFDSQNIKKIKVRQALKGEEITTFNQKIYHLEENDLVITDGQNAIALAGIVGLSSNRIKNNTKNIILEAAYFKPKTIIKTTQKLKIKTESSLRFERGIDPNLIPLALQKACSLLISLADAKITSQPVQQKKQELKAKSITLHLDYIQQKTGISFSLSQIKEWLLNLNYQVISQKNETLEVAPPLSRYDVKIKENIIADLIRLYGCNTTTMPTVSLLSSQQNKMTLQQKNLRTLKKLLMNLGFYETITYSLISQEMFNAFHYQKEHIAIINPLSQDKVILRQSLLSSLTEVLSHNHKRQTFDNAFFEIGKVYYPQEEILTLGLALSGNFLNSGWIKQNITSSFFVLKGIVEQISAFLGINLTYQKSSSNLNLHPHIQANLLYNNAIIGIIGKTHPQFNEKHHLKDSFLCEFLLTKTILNQTPTTLYQPISKFPVITRDLAFFINQKYSFEHVIQTINKDSSLDLINCELFDVYQVITSNQDKIRSLGLRFSFSNPNKNLDKPTIDQRIQTIIQTLMKKYQIQIR